MTTSLQIGREDLGLGPLELQDPSGGFRIYGPVVFSGLTLERTYPQRSPWVDYERPTHIQTNNGDYAIRVLVSGNTVDQLETRTQRLIRAVSEQFEFVAAWTVNGETRYYRCIAANVVPDSADGGLDQNWHREFKQPYILSGPHMGRFYPV